MGTERKCHGTVVIFTVGLQVAFYGQTEAGCQCCTLAGFRIDAVPALVSRVPEPGSALWSIMK